MKKTILIITGVLIIFLSYGQSLLEKWQNEKLVIEKSMTNLTNNYSKDTTNIKYRDSLSKLKKQGNEIDLKLVRAKQELDSLITGVYGDKINELNQKTSQVEETPGILQLFSWDNILLFIFTAISLFLLVNYLLLHNKKKRRDEIVTVLTGKKHEDGKSRLTEWQNKLIQSAIEDERINKNELIEIQKKYNLLEQKILDIQNSLETREKPNKNVLEKSNNIIELPNSSQKESLNKRSSLYADAIINGVFNKTTSFPTDDTIYELELKNTNNTHASFIILKDAYRRILKNTDFIDGCEKRFINSSPIDLEVISGEAILLDSGKWKVAKKLEVKFI